MAPMVLIAEDDPDLCDLMQLMLEHEGLGVVAVGNGAEVLPACKTYSPDIIVLDLNLPGLNGVEVTHAVRADPALSGVPILLVTGFGRDGGVAEALAGGATSYLTKPFRPVELIRLVTELLSQAA